MLPEMAVSYSIGLLPNLGATGLHLYLHRRKMLSPGMKQLRHNLSQIHCYWNDSKNRIENLRKNSFQEDLWAYQKGVFIFGALCFFMSWLGFFIQVMIMVSLRYIVISRFEQEIFSSELAAKSLATNEITSFLEDYRLRFKESVDCI